ncbi:hypothetical protein X739_26530 [Mesorhizobium sp. LNHC220B00]|nr:DUF2269 family protein [Mesorhizobium sp. LNHC220B00]ESY82767.1 hypothetical protein X739_26530 [Mesorhizobium sp. LNHC220B00]
MDWYSIVKLLHILSAMLWVGGGFTLMVQATLADRAGNIQGTLQAMRATGELGNRFFAPMSMLTLVFGLIMCWFWIGFSDLWVLIGLAGYAATFCIGMFVFNTTADRMAAMIARDGVTPAALGYGQRILRAARFDYAVMLVIITDMVLKPTLHDVVILAGMVVVLAAGATMALSRPRRMVPSAA